MNPICRFDQNIPYKMDLRKPLISIWLCVLLTSMYCIFYESIQVAKYMYLFQIVYKVSMFLYFDKYAKNIITKTNIAIIPVLVYSLVKTL